MGEFILIFMLIVIPGARGVHEGADRARGHPCGAHRGVHGRRGAHARAARVGAEGGHCGHARRPGSSAHGVEPTGGAGRASLRVLVTGR